MNFDLPDGLKKGARVVAAMSGGASHYMTKPFEPADLLAEVSRLLD